MKKILIAMVAMLISSIAYAEVLSIGFNAGASYNLLDSEIINTYKGGDYWLTDMRKNSNTVNLGVDFYLFSFIDVGFGIESRQVSNDCSESVVPNFFPYYVENTFKVSMDIGEIIPSLNGITIWFEHMCGHPEMPFYFGSYKTEGQYANSNFRNNNYEGFGISYKTDRIKLL